MSQIDKSYKKINLFLPKKIPDEARLFGTLECAFNICRRHRRFLSYIMELFYCSILYCCNKNRLSFNDYNLFDFAFVLKGCVNVDTYDSD